MLCLFWFETLSHAAPISEQSLSSFDGIPNTKGIETGWEVVGNKKQKCTFFIFQVNETKTCLLQTKLGFPSGTYRMVCDSVWRITTQCHSRTSMMFPLNYTKTLLAAIKKRFLSIYF